MGLDAAVGGARRIRQDSPGGSGLSAPMRAGQALLLRSVLPIRQYIGAYHPATGKDRLRAQVTQHSIVRPSISVDRRAVTAEPGGAVHQQSPDAIRAQVPQGDEWPW
jgi:hypothetical protein